MVLIHRGNQSHFAGIQFVFIRIGQKCRHFVRGIFIGTRGMQYIECSIVKRRIQLSIQQRPQFFNFHLMISNT